MLDTHCFLSITIEWSDFCEERKIIWEDYDDTILEKGTATRVEIFTVTVKRVETYLSASTTKERTAFVQFQKCPPPVKTDTPFRRKSKSNIGGGALH